MGASATLHRRLLSGGLVPEGLVPEGPVLGLAPSVSNCRQVSEPRVHSYEVDNGDLCQQGHRENSQVKRRHTARCL